MKTNRSIRFSVKSGPPIGHRLLHFNISEDEIEVFDVNLSTVARLKCFPGDQATVFVRGLSADQTWAITGFLGPKEQSIVTITSTESDEVIVIRGNPPPTVTTGDLIRRLLPAIAIVFFFGFGKIYQKRFWRQYRQMNTRSLQNRIRETKNRAKKER
jgi:hypothetical protein